MALIFLFILGVVVGSFLNVCIHRLPQGLSIVFPPSHCPSCEARLNPLDLIPILGYFLLRGKCRYCGVKISSRYPLVEFLSGLAFLWVWIFQSPPSIWDYVFKVVFIAVLIVVFFTDLEQQVIPDAVIKFGILAGLIYNSLPGFLSPKGMVSNPFVSALLGILLGYFLLLAIALLGKSWFKKEALGEGDLYLAALLGSYLSFK